MNDCSFYLNGDELEILPSDIQFTLPTRKESYRLLDLGEREIMRGIDLATITVHGILFYPETFYNDEVPLPSEKIEQWQDIAEVAQPVQLIYIAKAWDLNMMCTLQNISWKEVGGSFDIEYELILKKWLPIETQAAGNTTLPIRASAAANDAKSNADKKSKTYTIKDGDTLRHIAKCLLGDASRWEEIYQLNKDNIKNPNMIYTGQVLILPDDASGTVSKRSHGSSKTSSNKKSSTSKNSGSSSKSSSQTNTANTAKPVSTGTTSNKPEYQTAEDIYDRYKNKK